jgi:hypothetical protein
MSLVESKQEEYSNMPLFMLILFKMQIFSWFIFIQNQLFSWAIFPLKGTVQQKLTVFKVTSIQRPSFHIEPLIFYIKI